ncbi:MAG: porin family protein [Hyphomicrobium sp.]|nr:porin family protein [Hyphomicrobium sp.]
MRFIIATVGWCVVGASAVFAQDATPATNWQGFYVGLAGGEALADIQLVDLNRQASRTDSNNEAVAGAFGGYNWQLGAFVVGAEIDWMRNLSSEPSDFMTARARAGWTFGQSMIYGTLGIGTEQGYLQHLGTGQRIDKTLTGIVVGGGLESMLSQNLSIRAEGLYFDPGKEQFDFAASPPYAAASATVDLSHVVWRAGLTYHFK